MFITAIDLSSMNF